MDLVNLLIVVVITVVVVVFMAGPSTGRVLDGFGAGFLPYREAGWPRGVQEAEPIPWDFTSMTKRGLPPIDRDVAPDTGVEVFEIDVGDRAETELAGINHGRIIGGTSIRDRN